MAFIYFSTVTVWRIQMWIGAIVSSVTAYIQRDSCHYFCGFYI